MLQLIPGLPLRIFICGLLFAAFAMHGALASSIDKFHKDHAKLVHSHPRIPHFAVHKVHGSIADLLAAETPEGAKEILQDCLEAFPDVNCNLAAEAARIGLYSRADVATGYAMTYQLCLLDDALACDAVGQPLPHPPPVPLGTHSAGVNAVSNIDEFFYGTECKSGSGTDCLRAALAAAAAAPARTAEAMDFFDKACKAGENVGCLERACSSGAVQSCHDVGLAYLHGFPVGNRDRGLALLQQSCSAGTTSDCNAAAQFPLPALGPVATRVQRSRTPLNAYEPLAVACDKGAAYACRMIGLGLLHGLALPHDPSSGAMLLQQACNGNDAYACEAYANYRAPISKKDYVTYLSRALTINKNGCNAAGVPPDSCFRLALAYMNGVGVTKDLTQASADAALACSTFQQGYACRLAATLSGHPLPVTELKTALAHEANVFTVAAARDCDAGALFSCYALGEFYLHGAGVQTDLQRAATLLSRVCTAPQGFSVSCNEAATIPAAGSLPARTLCSRYADDAACVTLGQDASVPPADAIAVLSDACVRHYSQACSPLVARAEAAQQSGALTAQDVVSAYEAACSVTQLLGCADVLSVGSAQPTAEAQLYYYVIVCQFGNADGCNAIDRTVNAFAGVPARERQLWQTLCQVHPTLAGPCTRYAVMLANGQGGATDFPTALKLLDKDCAAGVAGACDDYYWVDGVSHQQTITIPNPWVQGAEMHSYPSVAFKPNDEVWIDAGGCVQTGGIGKTWKRYPTPVDYDNGQSGQLYVGLIGIPGYPHNTIGGIWHQWLTIKPATDYIPGPQWNLHLGYVDDDYHDNGYYDHDDGTHNQCAGVGAAWVTVTIRHHSTPPGESPTTAATPAPMDYVFTQTDANGFPLNPRWQYQIANSGALPDVYALCNGLSMNTDGTPNFGGCTTQAPVVDTRERNLLDPFWYACSGSGDQQENFGDNAPHGHINWTIATYTGSLNFKDWQKPYPHPGKLIPGDDDYDWNLDTPGHAGVLAHNQWEEPGPLLTLEFDSDEVIDHMNGGWWDAFHRIVDGTPGEHFDAPQGAVHNRDAEVIGLLGIDTKHAYHTELHPIFGMAFKIASTATTEDWAFFVREGGDEGSCSQMLNFVPDAQLTFWFPDSAGGQRHVDPKASDLHALPGVQWGEHRADDGLTVGFTMPRLEAATAPFAYGTLRLCKGVCATAAPPLALPSATASPGASVAAGASVQHDGTSVQPMISRLTPVQLQAFASAFSSPTPAPASIPISEMSAEISSERVSLTQPSMLALSSLTVFSYTQPARNDGIIADRHRNVLRGELIRPIHALTSGNAQHILEGMRMYNAFKAALGSDQAVQQLGAQAFP